MGVTVVLLFPLGSIFMRTVRHPWIHAGIQIFSMIAMIAGLVLGIRLANLTSMVRPLLTFSYQLYPNHV